MNGFFVEEGTEFVLQVCRCLERRKTPLTPQLLETMIVFLAQVGVTVPLEVRASGDGLTAAGVRTALAVLERRGDLLRFGRQYQVADNAAAPPVGLTEPVAYLSGFLPTTNHLRMSQHSLVLAALLACRQPGRTVGWREVSLAISRNKLLREDLKSVDRMHVYRVIAGIIADRLTVYWYDEALGRRVR